MTCGEASAEEHRSLRRIVGKSQFLAPRRPDIAFATNRLVRSLACPSKSDIIASKRLLRYLRGTQDLGLKLQVQNRACSSLTVFTDSDRAGDRPTRKSVSSWVIMLDGFLISAGARTQSVMLNRHVKLSTSRPQWSEVHTSSGAIGVASRRGLQRLRYLDVGFLWLQAETASKNIRVSKVPGLENVADANTKPADKRSLEFCRSTMGCNKFITIFLSLCHRS